MGRIADEDCCSLVADFLNRMRRRETVAANVSRAVSLLRLLTFVELNFDYVLRRPQFVWKINLNKSVLRRSDIGELVEHMLNVLIYLLLIHYQGGCNTTARNVDDVFINKN